MRIEMTNAYTNSMNIQMNSNWDQIQNKINSNHSNNDLKSLKTRAIDPNMYLRYVISMIHIYNYYYMICILYI